MKELYEASTGNHQGLIIEEETGRNVAVTYEKEDAALIVKAVNCHDDLLDACKGALAALSQNKTFPADIEAAKSFLNSAIQKVDG